MDYDEYINSHEWELKASDAKRRADFRCQVCYSPSDLQVHHRTYIRLGQEDPGDLTVLCDTCHEMYTKAHRITRWLLDPVPYKPISFERLLELELVR